MSNNLTRHISKLKNNIDSKAMGLIKVKILEEIENFYFNGTYMDDLDAPIPGDPCLTGLFVIENSPK